MANCVRQYYTLANKAELAICDSQLTQAHALYKEAFALDCQIAHRRDLANAFVLSCRLQQRTSAQKYALQLKAIGVGYDFLETTLLQHFGKKKQFLQKLKNTTLPPEYQLQQAALAQLLLFDQVPRGDCPGYPSTV